MRQFYLLSATLFLTAAVLIGCNESLDASPTKPETSASTEAIEEVQFANARCPIMGGKPNAGLTAQYDGKTIGFCCDGCQQKWAALSDEEKAEKFAKVSHDAAGNKAGHEGHDDHNHGEHS